jgi:LysM repeat protein
MITNNTGEEGSTAMWRIFATVIVVVCLYLLASDFAAAQTFEEDKLGIMGNYEEVASERIFKNINFSLFQRILAPIFEKEEQSEEVGYYRVAVYGSSTKVVPAIIGKIGNDLVNEGEVELFYREELINPEEVEAVRDHYVVKLGHKEYVVKKGQYLFRIARNNKIWAGLIKDFNPEKFANGRILQPGDKILIPEIVRGFQISGEASYYRNEEFPGKMANGHVYDDTNIKTVAHNTLPIGTVVHIIDGSSGETTEGVVDDRGPYPKLVKPALENRVADLTKKWAETHYPNNYKAKGLFEITLKVAA